MAVKRWLRIGGPVVAALLVAIALLPPRVPQGPSASFGVLFGKGSWTSARPERSQYTTDVLSARRTQRVQLVRARIADSIVAAAGGPRAVRSGGGRVALVYERPLTADSARAWLDAVERELALYPEERGHGMPLVVALLSDPARDKPKATPGLLWGVREFHDQAASAGACVVTVDLISRQSWLRPVVAHDAAGNPVTHVLGACALYARFGQPGPEVGRWMEGGYGFTWGELMTVQLQEARRRILRADMLSMSEGYPASYYAASRWLEVACLEGETAPCVREAGLGRESNGADLSFSYTRAITRNRLLVYVLATGTAEQFGAFWRSPGSPAEALHASYGKPAGTLVLAALRHWYTPVPGPSPWGGARNALDGLVWVGLGLAAAMAVGRHLKTAA